MRHLCDEHVATSKQYPVALVVACAAIGQVRTGTIDVFGEIVARLLGSGADAWLGASEQRRLADIARGEGKAFGALRVASGEVADLTTTWRGIEVRPLAGCISFELQRVPVTGVRSRSEPLSRREVRSVPLGQFEILVLDVPDGVLEWAILPEDAEWVREKLSG